MTDSNVTCVVLAAGAGSRFHDSGHKLLAQLPATCDRPAETVCSRAIGAAAAAAIGDVVVVTGRLDATTLGVDAVRSVHNPDWADGQMTSVQVGVAAARRADADIAVIGLADQPGVTADAWRSVAGAAANGAAIAVATYDGRRGNPVALRREVWSELATDGDEGARTLMRLRADLVVEVACTGSPTDIDTVEDLRRWQNNSSTNSP